MNSYFPQDTLYSSFDSDSHFGCGETIDLKILPHSKGQVKGKAFIISVVDHIFEPVNPALPRHMYRYTYKFMASGPITYTDGTNLQEPP